MSKQLKLGFIGGGTNSAVGTTHFIASQMDGCFKVEAGCFSRHDDINSQTAEQWNISSERCYNDINQLLIQEKGQLDAIAVLTPTPDHVEPIIHALRHGFPVISEKALASTVIDAARIARVQKEQCGFLTVTFNYTGYPMLRELKGLLQQGLLGRVEQIHIEMPQEGFARLNRDGNPMTPQQWRLRDGDVPIISLDLGVHVHHLIDFLTGEKPLELIALQTSQGRFRQVIDNTMCIARYTNQMECNIWFSKAALGYRNGLKIRVFGELASAEWHQMDPEFITFHDNKGHKRIIDRADVEIEIADKLRYNRFKSGHPAGFIEAFANLYADIADSLQDFQKSRQQKASSYIFTAGDALEGLVMMEAIARSSKDRCWVEVNSAAL